jgi:hypothetical protein
MGQWDTAADGSIALSRAHGSTELPAPAAISLTTSQQTQDSRKIASWAPIRRHQSGTLTAASPGSEGTYLLVATFNMRAEETRPLRPEWG